MPRKRKATTAAAAAPAPAAKKAKSAKTEEPPAEPQSAAKQLAEALKTAGNNKKAKIKVDKYCTQLLNGHVGIGLYRKHCNF